MRSRCPWIGHVFLGLVGGLITCSPAWAVLIDYTVDASRSELSLSGNWNGSSLWARPAGGLSTSYTGTIQVELTEATVQIMGATLDAIASGSYLPRFEGRGGRQSGDYGGFFRGGPQGQRGNVNTAFRNLGLDLSSLPISLTGDSFDAAALSVTAASGAMDYDGVGLLQGSVGRGRANISGTADNAATAGSLLNGETLTIPIDITFAVYIDSQMPEDFNRFDLTLTGTIVASRADSQPPGRGTPDVPEPATLSLMVAFALGLTLHRRRR